MFFFFSSRNGTRSNKFNMLWNDKHKKKAVTWYVETHQVGATRSPSSINSSSWFRPGMSPKGVLGLNIAWSTALSCAEAILPVSVKKAGKKEKTLTPKIQLGGEFVLPLLLPFPAANQRRGWKQIWTLKFACTEHICIWLTQKCRPGINTELLLEGKMEREWKWSQIFIRWFLLSAKGWKRFSMLWKLQWQNKYVCLKLADALRPVGSRYSFSRKYGQISRKTDES